MGTRTTLLLTIAAAALPVSAAGSTATDAVYTDRLAFVRWDDDPAETDPESDIYVLRVDRGAARPLTRGRTWRMSLSPTWSPGGTKLAFDAHVTYTSSSQIYVVDDDGGRLRRLTRGVRERDYNSIGSWSPDGRRIVYSRSVGGIYVMNADGSRKRVLVRRGGAPSWSPRGTWIVFLRGGVRGSDLYVVSDDGRRQRRLTRTGDVTDPLWAPDGRRIMFDRRNEGGESIHVIGTDGSGHRVLARGEAYSSDWSPDGRAILFTRNRHRAEGVYTVSSDGGRERRLTRVVNDSSPTWSPDGRRIAFVRAYRIWVMNADGSGARPVTRPRGRAVDRDPVWAPR